MEKIIIYTDGGSRGNPGEGAIGVVFSDERGKVLKTFNQAIGIVTNNDAEYQALILALKKAKALFGKDKIKNMTVEIRSDSELLVKQMKGEYKVLEPSMQKLFLEAWNLKVGLKNIDFIAVPREANKLADRLVNEALDASSASSGSLF